MKSSVADLGWEASDARTHCTLRSGLHCCAIVTLLVVALGAAERVRQYAARTSFWADEAFVVLNVRQHSALQLVGKLKWDQAAAPLYLWSLKGLSRVAGESEYSLRLVSLICALAGLAIYTGLARHTLAPPGALLAIALFALDRRLVEYAAEVKQYSGDVMISAALLWVGVGWQAASPVRHLARVAVVSAVTVWFSHATAIVFGGISLVLSLEAMRRDRGALTAVLACNGLFAVSFLTLYVLSIYPQHTEFLYQFWKESFPDPRHPLGIVPWLARQGFEFVQAPYRWPGPVFVILIVVAWLGARRPEDRELWLLCMTPIALTVLAAMVRQYPFNGSRLTLFLMPPFYLVVAMGMSALLEWLPRPIRLVFWALPVALIATGVAVGVARLRHPQYQSHIRPAVDYARAHAEPGDALVCVGQPSGKERRDPFSGRHLEALCYWAPPPGRVYTPIGPLTEVAERRFWVLVAFSPGEANSLTPLEQQMRRLGTERLRMIEPMGGAAFLFERTRDSAGGAAR